MITEEFAAKKTKSGNGARSKRTATVKDLETLCAKIRKAGGKPSTVVTFARESDGGIRLVAQIGK